MIGRVIFVAAALAVAGCAPRIELIEVMNHDACRGLTQGVHEISFEQLLAIRGLDVLSESGMDEPLDARLIAIAVGTQFGRGFFLRLRDHQVTEHGIDLELDLEQPAAGQKPPELLPGEEPRPCVVIATANRSLTVTARMGDRVIGTLVGSAPVPTAAGSGQ